MNELMTIKTYEEFEQAFDREVKNQAESFIRMGYLLRLAQDTDILYESRYSTIAEFAKAKYNLSADYVSRMIEVNKRYSEGGYSDRLLEKYRGYGYTLLSEMLTLSDQVVEALPDNVTREDIREIKREIKEEQRITEIEVMLEEPDEAQEIMDNNLSKVLHQYWREHIREYPAMFKTIKNTDNPKEAAISYLAPSGLGVLMVRVRGIGKFMLSIKGDDKDLELLNARTNESETYDWEACVNAMQQLCRGKNYKEAFETAYGEPYPEEKPAESITKPVKTEKTKAQNPQPSTNTDAHGFAPAQETKPIESTPKEEVATEPMQQSIEAYKEVLPDDYQSEPEVITRKETELWKEARKSTTRLFNTLTENEWSPYYYALIKEMCLEAENLKVILKNIFEMMENENEERDPE